MKKMVKKFTLFTLLIALLSNTNILVFAATEETVFSSIAPFSTPSINSTTSESASDILSTSSPSLPADSSILEQSESSIASPIISPSVDSPTTPSASPSSDSTATPNTSPSTDPTVTPNTSPSTTSSIPAGLEIDTENIYKGMDKAYNAGYTPTVQNEAVSIVLPLVPTNELYENEIVATPDFSSTASTFIISNYQKTIKLTEEKINNTNETKSIFYVNFDLPLASSRSNGTFPLVIKVKAYDKTGSLLETQFTIYINITDVVTATPTPQTSGVSTPTAEPVILITNCVIAPEKVLAGENFSLKLTLKNSLSTKAIKNLLVSVDTGTLQISLEENSNKFQLENIKANGTSELELNFSSDLSIPAGKYVITFNFTYDTWQSLNISSTGTIVVEITQPANMELVMPRVSEKTNSGETLQLSFQIMNMGRDSMYNVRCEASGIGLIPYNTGFIGTMPAGSSAETNIDLYVGTLTMSEDYTGDNMYGPTSGTIKLLYEDSSGEEYSQEFPFETSIGTPIIEDPTTSIYLEEEKEQSASQWWVSVVVLLVIILIFICSFLYRHRKRGLHEKNHR